MPSRERLCALLRAPREMHESIVLDLIAPLSREIREDRRLDALFFGRYSEPNWHLRVTILGQPGWIEGPLMDLLTRRLTSLSERDPRAGYEFGEGDPEGDRFGGEEGTRLAERIFHYDTLACLVRMEAETRGMVARSRREYCLLMTERLLDLMRFDRARRIAFYRHGYSFETGLGAWGPDELAALERHYRSIKEGLLELTRGDASQDPLALWGGAEPARAANDCLGALRPLVDELLRGVAAGRIQRSLGDLAWALAHMHANRLQIEADAEAILRYFMHRLHEEEDIVAL
jgi:thiopeptide-type bacteriocin biosynthesis protein